MASFATPHERSPLLNVVDVAPSPPRYKRHALRKISTALLLVTTLAVAVVLLLPGSSSSTRPLSSWPGSNGLHFSELLHLLASTPDEHRIRTSSEYYTSAPHLMGQNKSMAEWTRDLWQAHGVQDSRLIAYDVYTNYPRGHRLALYNASALAYEASLEENVVVGDNTSSHPNRIPTFHGYSASGNVTAQFVYVNYGTFWDYEDLVKAGVSLSGKIAIARYGAGFRGLKVKRAQELGMVGVLIYSDPGDDGETTVENGYKPYPHGPAREPSSVQRGSVQFLSFAPGDPTTPGYPSLPGAPRQNTSHAIPMIPSLPISYLDALPLLKALNGHGPIASDLNKHWQGGGLQYAGVRYNVGPSPPELTVNLLNDQEYVTTPMWNVIGIINGTTPDEVVVMGNHRDAWIVGGAADPNSGSAAFNEVIRGLGKALARGWKPRRTIVLASWDGEEYGLVGSTEWVEEYLPWLSESAVAYVNVDVATGGRSFKASSAPLLDHLLYQTTAAVQSPNQTREGQTVYDTWSKHIGTMGSGSDFTAFQDYAGIPSMDFGFERAGVAGEPIYHYHSNYDSFAWMDTFGDKGWHYHATIAKIWGLLAAELIDQPIIPFNASNYALALGSYLSSVEKKAEAASFVVDMAGTSSLSFAKLRRAIEYFDKAAKKLDARATALKKQLAEADGFAWYEMAQKTSLFREAQGVNQRYKHIERAFVYPGGYDQRPWFKHTVFAPGRWTGYAGATFPPLVEAIEDKDIGSAEKWQTIIAKQLYKAADALR